MIRTFQRLPLPSSASRREALGLMGAFLILFAGVPGHSELMLESAKHLASQLIQLILVFLGLATPVAQAPGVVAAPVAVIAHVKHHHAALIPDPNSMLLRRDPILHHYTYLFEGKATYKGEPCANASVLVRLLSGDNTATKGAVTNADGSYSFEVAIDAEDTSPVDWTVQAYTPDFKSVELSGRRIVQREEEQEQEKKPIIVTNPVEFIVSFSK